MNVCFVCTEDFQAMLAMYCYVLLLPCRGEPMPECPLQTWAGFYERQAVCMQHTSALNTTDVVEGKVSPIQLGVVEGAPRRNMNITSPCLRDSGSGFVFSFNLEAFSMIGYGRKLGKVSKFSLSWMDYNPDV